MPVPNLASRVVCGQFYWQFQNFMRARAERAKAARTRTVKACWPLSFVRTVFVCAVILAMCSSSDSHTGSGQSDNPGVHRQKNDTTSPIQHSVAALQSSMQMLAIATRADVTIFFSLALNRYGEVRNPGRTVKEK